MSAASASPPKEDAVASPENDQMNDPQDPHASGLGYEFEVKEQDRWLPIANDHSLLFRILRLAASGIASDHRAVPITRACATIRPVIEKSDGVTRGHTSYHGPRFSLPLSVSVFIPIPILVSIPVSVLRRSSLVQGREA
ncbi:uncharacterized protein BP5553_07885 [Venustampulla echinocandica]|uniref:Uncharacterized protein n=1 Tax=Venustampulla echinocandica TaxID=2656787 RepID=A0A370THT2_9HELO|nr:uncharacterized protein BP5553_07885 [Venustampulla echinocandica]RDL34757.1 hypothetical protein BP5553_07885 [Venustampulla echinocandica]